MSWGRGRRAKVSNRLGSPNRRDGSNGDMQIRQTNLGAKLFGKIGSEWYSAPLAIEGVTKFGTSLRNHLSIDNDSIDIMKNGIIVSSFGEDIKFNGKIVIGNPDGTFSATDNIVIGNDQSSLGVYNISLGYQAGKAFTALTTTNVAIGYTAGTAITGATTGNVCVGGYAGDNLEQGTYNSLIGYQCRASGVNVSYELAISAGSLTGQGEETMTWGRNTGNDFVTNDYDVNNTLTHGCDERIKKDINNNDLGLSFINKLRTVTFKKRHASEYSEEIRPDDANEQEPRTNPDKVYYGFIAQEVKAAMDEVDHSDFTVWRERPDGIQHLGEADLITPLTKAVQELSAKIDTMQEEINTLKQG